MPRTRRRPVLLAGFAGALLLTGAVSLFAEDLDVPKLFDTAKASFAEKHYGKCWSDLQLIIAEVSRFRAESLKTALPPAPAGWTAEEAEAENTAGWAWVAGGTQVKRTYKKGEETSAEVQLVADAPAALMMGINMFLSNPAFLPQGSKIVMVKGHRAVLEFKKEEKSGKLQIVLNAPNAFLSIEGRGLSSAGDLSDAIAGALDLDAIEKAIAN